MDFQNKRIQWENWGGNLTNMNESENKTTEDYIEQLEYEKIWKN